MALGPSLALVDDVLAHHGVKGMRWGVRGAKASGSHPDSEDAKTAEGLAKRAKGSNTKNLSNEELQKLVTRMNLEQQYSKATATPKALARIDTILSHVERAKKIHGYVTSPFGKEIRRRLEHPGATIRAVGTVVNAVTPTP